MDEFARRPPQDRQAYLEEAANRRNLRPAIIEKDFWVCWTLKRLTSSSQTTGHLIFKGGTSLSKAYGIINRFSEDIDLTIARTAPLIRDVKSPMQEDISGKERDRRAKALKDAAQHYVATIAMPVLERQINASLGTAEGWNVILDPDDPDAQTLLFHYPRLANYGNGFGRGRFGAGKFGEGEIGYIKPRIKLEFGARGDTEPSEPKPVSPYLAEDFPGELPNAAITFPTLSVTRTFWEKATILHALSHNGKLREGMSRHYYDVLMLAEGGIADQALTDPDLLAQVVRNKSLMFADKSASYETAVIGSLRLAPSGATVEKLKQDYAAMAEMFMAAPPSFDDLLAGITSLETRLKR
jgi:hypothetical protein